MLLAALREIFPFLAALYVLDGLAWVGALGFLFVHWPWGWRVSAGRGVRWAGLLPLDLAFASPGPVAIPTRDAVWIPDADVREAAVYDPERWTALLYERLSPELEERSLRLGDVQIRFPSRVHAEAFKERIEELRRAEPGGRELVLARQREAAFDLESARKRLETFRDETQFLRILSWGLFVLALLLLPAVLYLDPAPLRLLGPLLWAILSLYVATVGVFAHASSRLRRNGILLRPPSLAALVLSPISAARAVPALGRDLFAGFDPLTLAAVLLSRSRLLVRARAELYGAAAAAERGEEDWRRHWRERRKSLIQLLKQAGISEGEALAEPARLDSAARSWCPVCGIESRQETGACDCGMPLVRFQS